MLARLYLFVFTVFSILVIFSSCEDETRNNRQLLVGRWEIIQGFRNQRETQTLSGTYFQFGNDGMMQTNLPVGPEEPMAYTLSATEIRQKSIPPINYQIQSLNDSSLILNMEMRGMQFEMRFRRATEINPDSSGAPQQPDTLPVQDSSEE